MGGGGKGGSQSQEMEIKLPKAIEAASKDNLRIANEVASIGYTPYQGNTVAALTPMQKAAMDTTRGAMGAFNMGDGGFAASQAQGLDPYTGLAMQPTERGGVMGYNPMGIYEDAKGRIDPAQRAMIESFTMNPVTGEAPRNPAVPSSGWNPLTGETTRPEAAPAAASGKGGAQQDGSMMGQMMSQLSPNGRQVVGSLGTK